MASYFTVGALNEFYFFLLRLSNLKFFEYFRKIVFAGFLNKNRILLSIHVCHKHTNHVQNYRITNLKFLESKIWTNGKTWETINFEIKAFSPNAKLLKHSPAVSQMFNCTLLLSIFIFLFINEAWKKDKKNCGFEWSCH